MPRPSRLEVSISTLDGVGPKLAEAAAAIGIETLGDLLLARPARLPRPGRRRARSPSCGIGEQATVRSRCARRGCGRPAGAACDRRGDGRRRQRADEGGLVQPGLARRAPAARDAAAAATASSTGRGFRVADARDPRRRRRARRPGLHTTGIVPVHPATGAAARAAAPRVGLAGGRRWPRDAIEPLPAELRARRAAGGRRPTRCAAPTFPDVAEQAEAARERLAFEELFLYQAALAARARRRRDARPGDRAPGARASWSRAGSTSLPFELDRRPAARVRRDRRRPRRRASRCSGC